MRKPILEFQRQATPEVLRRLLGFADSKKNLWHVGLALNTLRAHCFEAL